MSTESAGAGQIPLSFSQEFMCMFDQGDEQGPFGPRYHVVYGWRVLGEVDVETLHAALADVVARHEILRTVLVRGAQSRYPVLHPPCSPELVVRDLTGTGPAARDRAAEELLIEIEASEYSFRQPPMVRAVLGRFDAHDSVLVLIAQHISADGWSMQVIIKELAECYAARRAHRAPDLPDIVQYREYAAWERTSMTDEALDRGRAYWRETLAGARLTPIHSDFPRSANLPKNTSVERYLVGSDVTAATLELARSTRSSAFMVLLAAYNVMLREMTGSTDLTVTTMMSGRGQARFENTIGSFFNFVALRTSLDGCGSFREVVERTRRTCLGAFSRAIPFPAVMAESPELAEAFFAEDSQVFAFQVFQFPFVMAAQRVGDLEYSEIRRRLLPAAVSTDIADGALWTIDIDPANDEMIGQLQFNSNRFDASTIRGLISEYLQVLKRSVSTPD
jgi:hypothetical protein